MAPPTNRALASKQHQRYSQLSRKRRCLQSMPFLTDTIMNGPASCKLADISLPRLRKCPFDLGLISWKDASVLGSGVDGWVWRVHFGDQGPFALKMFWISKQPTENPDNFAVQRECQNMAYIQMMQAAVEQANKEGGSKAVLLYPDPKIHEDARENAFAFAEENRLNPPTPEEQEVDRLVPLTVIPSITKCYGWLKFNTEEILPQILAKLQPHPVTIGKTTRRIKKGEEYIAIVYEYVEDGPNDPAKVEQFLEFIHLVGFCAASSPHGLNWRNSMLVDFSDIISPFSYGWHKSRYIRFPATWFLRGGSAHT